MTNEFSVQLTYFDSGTRKNHTVEYRVEASGPDEARKRALQRFDSYQKNNMGSWNRILDPGSVTVTEIEA